MSLILFWDTWSRDQRHSRENSKFYILGFELGTLTAELESNQFHVLKMVIFAYCAMLVKLIQRNSIMRKKALLSPES